MIEAIETLARPALLVARFLWWLAWDLLVNTIAWSIGWPIWKLLTLGRFPQAGFREYEESGTLEAILVCGVGLIVLAASVWFLANHVVMGTAQGAAA